MTKPEPLTRQVGGDHYAKLPVQPIEFATEHFYDPCAFSILKYVTRWRDKGGVRDLEKALHLAEIRSTDKFRKLLPTRSGYGIDAAKDYSTYVVANKIPRAEGRVIRYLHQWVYFRGDHGHIVISELKKLINSQSVQKETP